MKCPRHNPSHRHNFLPSTSDRWRRRRWMLLRAAAMSLVTSEDAARVDGGAWSGAGQGPRGRRQLRAAASPLSRDTARLCAPASPCCCCISVGCCCISGGAGQGIAAAVTAGGCCVLLQQASNHVSVPAGRQDSSNFSHFFSVLYVPSCVAGSEW